jgi:hypothetical protein
VFNAAVAVVDEGAAEVEFNVELEVELGPPNVLATVVVLLNIELIAECATLLVVV